MADSQDLIPDDGDAATTENADSPGRPAADFLDADRWAECTDPDDSDYLRGTAMSRD